MLPNKSPIIPLPPRVSLILSNKLISFLAVKTIPPLAKPAKISVNDTLSAINPKTFLNAFQSFSATVQIASPILTNISPKLFIPVVAPFKTPDIVPMILEKLPEISVVSNPSLILVKKSPIAAAASRNNAAKLPTPSEPIS